MSVRDAVVRLRNEGRTYGEIARLLGITKGSAIGHGQRAGISNPAAGNRRPWTAEEVERLREMLRNGVSRSGMARALDRPVDSIKQKLRTMRAGTMRVPRAPSPAAPPPERATGSVRQSRQRVARLPPGRDAPTSPAAAPLLPPRGLFTAGTRRASCCMWPIGEPRSPGFRYCEAARAEHSTSYCAEHHALAWRPAKLKERAA